MRPTTSPQRTLLVLVLLTALASSPAAAASLKRNIEQADLGLDLEVTTLEVRDSLRSINVLFIDNDNAEIVWQLEDQPDAIDVVVVASAPERLSTDVIEALANWAKRGHGLFLSAASLYQASKFLLPEGYYAYPHLVNPKIYKMYTWVAEDSPFTRGLTRIKNELWCSNDGTSVLNLRAESVRSTHSPEKALFDLEEKFFPILSLGSHPQRARSILLATTYEEARVVWYAYDVERDKKCQPQADDLRLWANLMHWLATDEFLE